MLKDCDYDFDPLYRGIINYSKFDFRYTVFLFFFFYIVRITEEKFNYLFVFIR